MRYILLIGLVLLMISCEEKKEPQNDNDLIDSDMSDDDIDSIDEDVFDCENADFEKWDKEFDGYSINKIKKNSDGNYIFLGSWHEFQDPWNLSFSMIGNLNPDFTIKWGAIFEEEGYGRNINDFKIDGKGNVYAAGRANDGASFWLISFSPEGNILWEKDWRYDEFYYPDSNIFYSIEVGNDGIYAAGFTAGWDEEGKASFPMLYFAKTDFEGNLIWEKVWGPRGSLISSIVKDSDGNFYHAGYTTGSLDGNSNAGNIGDCDGFFQLGPVGESSCPDPFLIKTDKDGNVLWNKQWGTDAINIETSTRLLIDNNDIYALSQKQSRESLGLLNVTKFDTDGKMKFSRDSVENGRDSIELGYDIYMDKNGVLIVSGLSREKDIPVEGYAVAVDRETGDMKGEKRFYGQSEKILFSAVFENESGLNAAGHEQTGTYEPTPNNPEPVYGYGIKNLGYFYLDAKPGIDITKGDESVRETVQIGSQKDDEAVFSFEDPDGNIFIAGNSWGSIDGVKNKGEKDIFVAKYKADGTKEWIKNYGSTDWDDLSAGFADVDGNIILTGTTWGDFEGNQRLGVGDIFVMKIDKTGKKLWATTAGSDNDDWVNGLWVDNSGNIYVTGGTYGSIDDNEFSGGFGCDMFVGKWSGDGEKILINQWGQRIEGFGLIGDSSGNVYLAGRTESNYADQPVFDSGMPDSIIFKLNSNLEEQWAKIWGTEEVDSATGIAVDSAGDIFVTGYTFGPIDKNIHLGADCPGGYCPDAYLTKWDSTGKKKWTRQFGTENGDRASLIVIDEKDNIYISGTAGKNRLCEIESDIFLMKSDASGNLDEIKIWGTAGEESVNSINISNGKIIISGFTTGGLDENTNSGQIDGFITVIE